MIDLTGITHHPAIEEITDVLCKKTQNTDRGFFRVEVAYFLAKMASTMRANINTKDRGKIPVNIYAIALALSGYGKGHSVNLLETAFMRGFRRRFMMETFPIKANEHLQTLSTERAVRNGTDQATEFESLRAEFIRQGVYAFTFDDGTDVAVKQLRHKILMANVGSINYQVDEIGSNLVRSEPILNTFLELYDQGLIKQKLTKNTSENIRTEEIEGKSPTNMLLFGTPSKLFDGGKTEECFFSLLETGYARRCLFAFGDKERKARNSQTPEQIYRALVSPHNDAMITKWSDLFQELADPARVEWQMDVEDDVGILLTEYQVLCERAAQTMKEIDILKRTELEHRHFKALKLAGALAFVDGSTEIEEIHLKQAILLVEESAQAFTRIMHREKIHVRLGKYIADVGTPLTQHDLMEQLPFFRGSVSQRNDMLSLATSWGYTNNVIIKKTYDDGIEFFQGETLKKTDLSKIRISYSDNFAYNYLGEEAPFDMMHMLTQAPGLNWCNHWFERGHRLDDNLIPGFNLLVFDVDGGTTLEAVHSLLKDYTFMTYTTKRHTPDAHRFRILLPINYVLELNKQEYKDMVDDVITWLPFSASVDDASNQPSKKWMTHESGTYHYNLNQELLDVLPFIPKTRKNDDYKNQMKTIASLDNLERWFAQKMSQGNRNNHMIKFTMALVDSGLSFEEVRRRVISFNEKLSDPLPAGELDSTVLVTAARKIQKQGGV